jgi:AcrR family transcriptional regulator
LSSQENDERLLEAALDEIAAVGVDGLGMSGVARRAGLTTGALYGRYENVNELAAAVWTARVRDAHFALLDAAVRALVDGDESIAVAQFVGELSCPSRATICALELLATAHRIDELDEVVAPDLEGWLKGWGAAPRGRQRLRRAQVLFTIGSLWGVLLHAIPRARPADWERVFTDVGRSYTRRQDPLVTRFVPEPAGPVRASVGDGSQNALIDSVLAITARVGFDRATASRIARRANLTSGAIYARYETKEELLAHAIEALLAQRLADDLEANTYLFTAPDVGAATAAVVGGYLNPARRDWRIFRVEAQIAARHHPPIAAVLDRVQEAAIRAYLDALGARNDEERLLLDGVARFAQLVPLGLAFADLVTPGVPATDWRYVFVPLLTAGAP